MVDRYILQYILLLLANSQADGLTLQEVMSDILVVLSPGEQPSFEDWQLLSKQMDQLISQDYPPVHIFQGRYHLTLEGIATVALLDELTHPAAIRH